MDSLRLPPLNFDALPSPSKFHCQLPPITQPPLYPPVNCHQQYSSTTAPLLPSLSPLLNETAHVTATRTSPIASYRQSCSRTCSSPGSSSQSPSLMSPLPATLPLVHDIPSVTCVPIAPVKRAIETPKGIREVYTCPFRSCNRISSEHSNMKAHMRLHTGERPYVCRVASCRKSFRWKSSLTYHERALHSNARPYQCIPCRKSFVEKRKLRLHHQLCPAVRAVHSHMLQQDFKVPS